MSLIEFMIHKNSTDFQRAPDYQSVRADENSARRRSLDLKFRSNA